MQRELLRQAASIIEATLFEVVYDSHLLSLLESKAVGYDLAAQVTSSVFPLQCLSSSAKVSVQAARWRPSSSGSETFRRTAFCSPTDDLSKASKVSLGGLGKLKNSCESLIHPQSRNPDTMSSNKCLSGNSKSSKISLKRRSHFPCKTCLTCSSSCSLRFRSSTSSSFALASHRLKKESLCCSKPRQFCPKFAPNRVSKCGLPA